MLADVPGAYRAGLAVVEGGGRRLLFTASDRDGTSSVPWCEIDAYADVPLTHTVRTGDVMAGSRESLAGRFGDFMDRQLPKMMSLVTVPVVSAGQVMGGYILFYDCPQSFDPSQVSDLEDVGAQLGEGLRRVQRAVTPAGALAAMAVPAGVRAATHSVAPDTHGVARARHFASRTLAAWDVDEAVAYNALLCLSELVTNAVIHTGAGCEVQLLLDQQALTATVRDGGSNVVVDPKRVEQDPLAVHGRGLSLVDALATGWGSELDPGGMSVWFVLELNVSARG
ncbi:hypothetical protein ASC58_19675 [Phycicoccus sp. Root101]|nr:hypothetical protein ASC58_19675 [Phycicoccus sp. Root101]